MSELEDVTELLVEVARRYKQMDKDDREVVEELLEFVSDEAAWNWAHLDYDESDISLQFEQRRNMFIEAREDDREELAEDEYQGSFNEPLWHIIRSSNAQASPQTLIDAVGDIAFVEERIGVISDLKPPVNIFHYMSCQNRHWGLWTQCVVGLWIRAGYSLEGQADTKRRRRELVDILAKEFKMDAPEIVSRMGNVTEQQVKQQINHAIAHTTASA